MKSVANRLLVYFLLIQAATLCLLSYVNRGDAITLDAARNLVQHRSLMRGKPAPILSAEDSSSKKPVTVDPRDGTAKLLIFVNCPCQTSTAQEWIDGAYNDGEKPVVFMPKSSDDISLSLAGKITRAPIYSIRPDVLQAIGKSNKFPDEYHVASDGTILSGN